jgi:hypothetical protein
MGKRITYLLGAGASANTIPVVAFMHERMKELAVHFYRMLKRHVDTKDFTKTSEYNWDLHHCMGILDRIYNELDWLITEAGDYYTIDTLAKKFYLMDDINSLKRLKRSLITYFTLEQILFVPNNFSKQRTDKRYGSFLAAISKKRYPIAGGNPNGLAAENLGFALSNQIRILSWNYDMQFELAIKSLTQTTIQHIKKEFQILPNIESKSEVNKINLAIDRFAMVKLNGDAIWNKNMESGNLYGATIFDLISKRDSEDQLLINFLQAYVRSDIEKTMQNDSLTPARSFNFAWENDANFIDKYPGHEKNLETAELIASETEILVVIGYSFPIFNREIDTKIFNKMNKLKKVYIQDKDPDRIKSTMINAFQRLQEKELVNKITGARVLQGKRPDVVDDYINKDIVEFKVENYTDQFVIPYELNQ